MGSPRTVHLQHSQPTRLMMCQSPVKACQVFGITQPTPETFPPHPTVPDCLSVALGSTGGLFVLCCLLCKHTLLSPACCPALVKAQAFLTPHPQWGGRSCGVLKKTTHSKTLHKTPDAIPSRCIFKRGTKQEEVWNKRQLMTSLAPVSEQCVPTCKN